MTAIRRAGLVGLMVSTLALGTSLTAAGEIVWWTPNWGEARARELADKFMAANPGITIRMEVTVANGLPERVLTALQSGTPPDIIEVQHGWVNGYAQNDLIVPLDDVIEEKEDYTPAALNYVTWDGRLWAIPYRIETHAIIFNKGLWQAAGLDVDNPPQTWDELVAAAQTLTDSGVSGFAITGGGEVGNTIFRSLPFIWMNGGDIISQDLKTAVVNSPEAVEAVTFYTDFYKNGHSPASTLENDGLANRRLFIANQVATYQSGQFDVPAIRQENPAIDIGAFPIPHPEGKQTAAILGGWSYVVPKDARNPEEAKLFLQFLNSSENQAFFTDTFPARISAMAAERFNDPILAAFKAMLPHGRPVPIHKSWVQITQAYFDGIQRILLGEQTVQESMDQANEEIQALLDS
ncbi:MAG TPA: sugar ABC transporter substrate-binding protein [Alphaproteobacteria bacterium]|nr:sugar ABC transporter substrate-binding protein [Alphaproteobacteria bacterium]